MFEIMYWIVQEWLLKTGGLCTEVLLNTGYVLYICMHNTHCLMCTV